MQWFDYCAVQKILGRNFPGDTLPCDAPACMPASAEDARRGKPGEQYTSLFPLLFQKQVWIVIAMQRNRGQRTIVPEYQRALFSAPHFLSIGQLVVIRPHLGKAAPAATPHGI
jgi:hypothetical protein